MGSIAQDCYPATLTITTDEGWTFKVSVTDLHVWAWLSQNDDIQASDDFRPGIWVRKNECGYWGPVGDQFEGYPEISNKLEAAYQHLIGISQASA